MSGTETAACRRQIDGRWKPPTFCAAEAGTVLTHCDHDLHLHDLYDLGGEELKLSQRCIATHLRATSGHAVSLAVLTSGQRTAGSGALSQSRVTARCSHSGPCVQSHALTSVCTCKSPALAAIALFGQIKAIQQTL